jgi:hypothetical protein
VQRLGLADTHPPQAPGIWGYTATSAADVAQTYGYILDRTHPRFREFLLRALRNWTRYGCDGFDQSFGIPRATSVTGVIKQGWSGFDGGPIDAQAHPADQCSQNTGLDLTRRAMHTSGTVGRDDDRIIVVLTLHSARTSWHTCAQRVTTVTRVLDRATMNGHGTSGRGGVR